jgi:hypothetical protein
MPPPAHQRVERPADQDLADAVADPGGSTVVLCQVLAGLGGVGKTQVAAALAHRLWNARQIDLLVWLTAASRTAVLTGYADAHSRVTGSDETGLEHAAQRFLAWLAEPHSRRWLIVLDDLDDPDDLIGLWPPDVPGGLTVVTTRRRDSALLAGRRLVDVDVFTPDQAGVYLRGKLAHQPDRLAGADRLARELGYLPLALSQAVAYVLDRGRRMTCARYSQLLAEQRRSLADLAPQSLPDQHRSIVAATWSLSVDRANRLPPAGVVRPVLEIAALLDPNGIPAEALTSGPVADYCTSLLGRPVDGDALDDALHTLSRFSLLSFTHADSSVRIHGLLQRVVRDGTTPARRADLAIIAADALQDLWPETERDAAHAEALRANTAALRTTAGIHLYRLGRGAHPVLFKAADSLGLVGSPTAALTAYEQLLRETLDMLGPDHPDTLITRRNLAGWRGDSGDPAGAASDHQQLLPHMMQVLGPDHADTLQTRNDLAYFQALAGDAVGAADACTALLADQIRVLGPDHRQTLETRNNLASWLGRAGNPRAAAEMSEALLIDELRILGPDHLDTLTTRSVIAHWRSEADGAAAGLVILEPLAADLRRVLGPDHPLALGLRSSLAYRRGQVGDVAAATEMCAQTITDCLRVLGPHHLHTLQGRRVLANLRGLDGDAVSAVAMLLELLTDQLRDLGPGHFLVEETRNDIAKWRAQTAAEQSTRDR